MQEKIIETKMCHCGIQFNITEKDVDFYSKVSPAIGGIKYDIPLPTLCPDCRQQRRLSFRNERNLYKRKCSLTGKDIISIYSPDKPYVIYEQGEWWSDKWDAKTYGKDFDFSKGFFDQFEQLQLSVPYMSLSNEHNEDSTYNNDTGYCKNTYLCFFSSKIENSYYINGSFAVYDSMDIGWSKDVENSYECFNCGNIYKCFHCSSCDDCRESFHCYNCTNCKNCFGCVGLKNMEYCLYNRQLDRDEYTKQTQEILNNKDKSQILTEVHSLKIKLPVKYANIDNSNNSVGDYIYFSNDCDNCYEVEGVNNGRYLSQCARSNDVYYCDNTGGKSGGMLLEDLGVYDSFKTIFSMTTSIGTDVLYSDNCYSSSNIFGCIGLRNAKYCILNKQYDRETYEELVPRIIEHMRKNGEWGEFFPSSISHFGYNETVAMEYYPINPSSIPPLSKGGVNYVDGVFKWSTYENPIPQVTKIIPASKLPENIKDIPDDILNWAIECEVTNKPFRIIKPELDFYRKYGLSIPKRHPEQRHHDRMNQRNPRKLHDRNCMKCGVEIKTTFSPDRQEIIYCEHCYNKEVY